jgi:hypothetical protein
MLLSSACPSVYDYCVSVDSAYHFPRKQELFCLVYSSLREGGAFAFSEILLLDVGLARDSL